MTGSASLPWWLYGVAAIHTGGHSHIFYGHFSDVGWGAVPDREHHVTVFLARSATIIDQGGGEETGPRGRSFHTVSCQKYFRTYQFDENASN